MTRSPRAPRAWHVRAAYGLGVALTVAFASLSTPTAAFAENGPPAQQAEAERSVTYSVEGEHDTRGPFTGTVSATFNGNHAVVSQSMTFEDGSSDTLEIRGKVRNNRVSGRVTEREQWQTGAVQALQGNSAAPISASRTRGLRVSFEGEGIRTQILEGAHKKECVVASAIGALQASPVDQGVSEEEKETFNHRTQGLNLMPTGWFMALEQAASEEPFKAPEHMARFGFLDDEGTELPVGFAIQGEFVGLTCGACHTAEIKVFGETVRIEGGRGNVNLGMFKTAVGQALGATAQDPAKFQRFAAKVLTLGEKPVNAEGMQAIGAAVKGFLVKAQEKGKLVAQLGLSPVDAGPGRVDAFGNGSNTIFGPLNPKNLTPADGPVRFPYLWGTADFAWVQYNGGIRLPLARNLIASVAAGAKLSILDETGALLPEGERYMSAARATDLEALESAMTSIGAPKWPGYIDSAASKRGGKLYQENCASCHSGARWVAGSRYGERFRELPLIPLERIGTDPNNARSFARTVDASAIGLGTVTVPEGLGFISSQILAQQGATPARPNDLRAPQAYRARPLDGIWAAAPYLHNGSVLSISELLGPVSERRTTFKLSVQPELDSEALGFVEPTEGFEFDTTQTGNSNAGHEFRDAPANTKGVIGRALSEQERSDLIEYLKTL